MRRPVIILAAAAVIAGCSSTDITGDTSGLTPPANLTYQLAPSGDPTTPESIMLRWDPVDDSRITNYVVYSRGSSSQEWSRRAETTSASFNDLGIPDFQYQVASQAADGSESAPSNTITVDASNTLIAPGTLSSISLNQAVWLNWPADSRLDAPDLFDYYRVYSTPYDLDQNLCDADWVLEGTTVSEDFLASGLPNGAPRCFAVSAVSFDGHESDWTVPRSDTPRPDARNFLLFASQEDVATSGFSFYVPSSGELGVVLSGNRTDIDFRVDRQSDGSMWLVPVRTGTVLALYSVDPLTDLTSIDIAPPDDEFSAGAIEAVPGYGYVFRTLIGGQYHYAGLRVTNVSSDYIIVDWSYQRDPGNPELSRGGR
jgi:hypothetical protein